MKLNRFLKRQIPWFRQHSALGFVGGRDTYLYHFGNFPLRPFKGQLSRHRLILMRTGSVAIQREGQTYLAEPGDAVLVPAGECELTFLQCRQAREVHAEILEFDHRTLAPRFRNSGGWESLALGIDDPAVSAIRLPGMARTVDALLAAQVPARLNFSVIMGELFGQFRRGLPQFLREHFYLRRWRLFALVERYLQLPNGIVHLGANYPGGAMQLRKDCRLYLGAEPQAILAQRRCELATAWLRCAHSIDEVGQALGFSSRWEFESVYSGRMRRRCADVQGMSPLATAEPEELVAAMRPGWWPESWPTRVQIPAQPKHPGFLSEMYPDVPDDLEGNCEDAGLKEGGAAGDLDSRRAKAAEALRESARDFFAMKSTGADIIVPIFGEIIESLAA